ncbi:hypothetical protein CYMTET_24698 [Cymbomonas tetramitiformis]|uniref:Uncharacterized protein n=1 Tax=Cymbomonas tetramitiformis TaxID=36881 RepID=A0AAE0FW60_9CHLO|nr:hypothetical protein CYMTET_24698 [Cymbomonas tetramitiformis]
MTERRTADEDGLPRNNPLVEKGGYIFAATPLPLGGNWSQSISHNVAVHKGTGQAIPLCGNEECMVSRLRHWYRDCPRGGKRANGAHAFVTEDVDHDFVFAVYFQTAAIDTGDNDNFQAACLLAGGKPEIIEDISTNQVLPTGGDTHMGVCTVGGAPQRVNINGFKNSVAATPSPTPPPPPPPAEVTDGPPSAVGGVGG